MIVQNPPSIPTLGVSRFFVLFLSRRTKLIIDWHNLGYSILSLKLDKKKQKNIPNSSSSSSTSTSKIEPDETTAESSDISTIDSSYDDSELHHHHPFVRFYKWYEGFFGNHAFCHFTVTIRMGEVIRRRFKMKARRILPLYDRPALDFQPLSFEEKLTVIKAHSQKGDIFEDLVGPNIHEKIIITSTSYTPDEDIYMLLDAVKQYDDIKKKKKNKKSSTLPNLRVIITGKGPMLKEIQTYIAEQLSPTLSHVRIYTTWLSTDDYPLVLGTADVGVSLHMSSSGVDLPMKAVDMFGCGVPVISVLYPALPELIKDKVNGLHIKTSTDLANALESLFQNSKLYDQIKAGAIRESRIKWDHEWNKKVGPLFGIGEYRQRADGEESDSSSSSSDDGL